MKIRIAFCLAMIWASGPRSEAQTIEILDLQDYQALIQRSHSKLKVVNFWATWCAPCIRELSSFVRMDQELQAQSTILLVSLDAKKMKERVRRTLIKNGFAGSSYLLQAKDSELSQLYPGWTGAVPLTLVFDPRNELIASFEREITFETIEKLVTNK